MSEMPESNKEQSNKPSEESPEDLVVNPIKIARARHASTHGHSVIPPAKTETSPIKAEAKSRPESLGEQASKPVRPKTKSKTPDKASAYFGSSSGCFLIALLVFVFVIGGALGGVIGGGMFLWITNQDFIVQARNTPIPTVTPSPTPRPVETSTPTPTPQPVNTPSISDVIEKIFPAVVTVINQQQNQLSLQANDGRVVGSGVIIDANGYIATNNHVVDQPGSLKVLLSDGRETGAVLVAANPAEDLAVLKIDLADLPTVEWGVSGQIRPGQVVYAIGSPLGDFPNSVSIGIISGLNRALEIDTFVIDGLIQTDAAVNRGSSGGPLITPDGKVIGINTFIIRESEERGIAEGIAFAIPAETAKNLLIPWIAAHSGQSVPIPAADESK